MREPQTKEQLLECIHRSRDDFWVLIEALDSDRLRTPGVQGVWSIKDIVAHIVAWEHWLLGLLREAAGGEHFTPRSWTDLDARNDEIYQEWKDRRLSLVLSEFTSTGLELRRAIEPFTDDELFTPGRYDGPGAGGLARLIAGDTYRHYATHQRAIETWLAEDSLDPRVYYACPGPVTHPHGYKRMLDGLPTDVAGLVKVLQGLLLHIFWAERYGVSLSEERSQEVNLRLVTRMLARIRSLDARPLSEPRDLEHRLVGNCRDFTVLLVAMMRHQGIPARARCGFGAYFMPDHYEDHWVAEYWNGDLGRWVLVDGQIDAFQREQLQLAFDPLDVPRDQFIVAGQAWQMCREGKADPDAFGIFDMHGWDFIRGNLIRDLLALNKVEILPWDGGHGYLATGVSENRALEDCWATLTTGGDATFGDVRALFRSEPNLHVPAQWLGEA